MPRPSPPFRNHTRWLATALVFSGGSYIAYEKYQPFRHSILAVVRCSRVAQAAVLGIVDYKWTFSRTYESDEQRKKEYSKCHSRSAHRLLKALLANGGIYIKLGQHLAAVFMLPTAGLEWTLAMRPLQDRCDPTPCENIEQMFLSDIGVSLYDLFDEFDPKPIGVASLAQVHAARHRASGRKVAIKFQHPHLLEFSEIDMETVEIALGWIKYWFEDFEFTWLGEEMRASLPKELDFVNEARNGMQTAKDFAGMRTSLHIPEIIAASKRVLVMEYIDGARIDDLAYLSNTGIDRNKVAVELARIFDQMVFVNGSFHADPHLGNLLIRPAPPGSRSPYNFEIVLLDHGQYFDMDDTLRVNYCKFWLSLIQPATPEVLQERKQLAQIVGNIGPELYPVFEAALTGRAAMTGSWEEGEGAPQFHRAGSMMDMSPQTQAETDAIRNAVANKEGLLGDVFTVLRRVPRRIIMVLKLNDLTRSLDYALATTHSHIRIWLIAAKYCAYAIWHDERSRLFDTMKVHGFMSFGLLWKYFGAWWKYTTITSKMTILETVLDIHARLVLMRAWMQGLMHHGLSGAHDAAAGLA
ncbi:ABC1-domain-containing protein [Fistulina hepatica ATCC 64428]|uniref:ABC1-domain-containing protein n=1 Tax=Fistulina hepatica ATCC 64428 TaxID=1128425 RepID=A0A0D7AHP8_9AGAR|nr:ABC1-domain-containing protein [Fistulina hepatica ATCC 64428]